MKIGIVELIVDAPPATPAELLYNRIFMAPQVGIMPQVIGVWCRQLGHQVDYKTYYGQTDLSSIFDTDTDIIFISAFTQASALAYALARLFRRRGAVTVLGGPHAKAFPQDALRFFDYVVGDCNKRLIEDVLRGRFELHSFVSGQFDPGEIAPLRLRCELQTPVTSMGRSIVPIYSSFGCPYQCDFCVDARSKYRPQDRELLADDLAYIRSAIPNAFVVFHDPNFGVRFDETLSLVEEHWTGSNVTFGIEATISTLNERRLDRLRRTQCLYIQSGVESWNAYSDKARTTRLNAADKFTHIVEHFRKALTFVPALQGNLIFGTDADEGDLPIEFTKKFIGDLPRVWCSNNIPTPYGGTPLHEQLCREGRILTTMPFSFYYTPYLASVPKNYDAENFYRLTSEIFRFNSSMTMNTRRLLSGSKIKFNALHILRALNHRKDLHTISDIMSQFSDDASFLRFHEGRSRDLPRYYRKKLMDRLGPARDLLEFDDLIPDGRCFEPSEPRLGVPTEAVSKTNATLFRTSEMRGLE